MNPYTGLNVTPGDDFIAIRKVLPYPSPAGEALGRLEGLLTMLRDQAAFFFSDRKLSAEDVLAELERLQKENTRWVTALTHIVLDPDITSDEATEVARAALDLHG